MKSVAAKVCLGTILLGYALYGYATGAIYKVPSKFNLDELSVSGGGLLLCASGYAAFAFAFYVSAFPSKTRFKKTKGRLFKTPRQLTIAILCFLGIALLAVCDVLY